MTADFAAFKKLDFTELATIDPGKRRQTIDGWGTNLVWWAEEVGKWDEPARREIMDLVFGEEGLNLNIVRYNFGGSSTNPDIDSSMHPARKMLGRAVGYDEEAKQIIYDHSNVDCGQAWLIKDLIAHYDVHYMEAQVNSPPWWMTISGSAAGHVDGFEENLAPDNYDLFVSYLTEMLKHFRDQEGVAFDHINPFNEPVSGYWKQGGSQEGAYFSPKVQQIILKKLWYRLQEEGLQTKIVVSDETSIDQAITTYQSLDEETRAMIGRIQTHTYGGVQREQLRDLSTAEKKPLWMSEVSTGQLPFSENEMAPAIPLAQLIIRDLQDMAVQAWVVWQAVEDRVENFVSLHKGPDYLKPWDVPQSWGLINGDYSNLDLSGEYGPAYVFKRGQYVMTKQYYVMKQFSYFIRPGYVIIESGSRDVVAALGPDSRLILVVPNFTEEETSITFSLEHFDTANAIVQTYRTSDTEAFARLADSDIQSARLVVRLPAKSLTTYSIHQAISKEELGN